MECLSENTPLSNADIGYFLTFIQTVPYRRNINESYVEAWIRIILPWLKQEQVYMTIKKL